MLLKYQKYLYFSRNKSINIFQVLASILLRVSIIFNNQYFSHTNIFQILIIWIQEKYRYLKNTDTLIQKSIDTMILKKVMILLKTIEHLKSIDTLIHFKYWNLKSCDILKVSILFLQVSMPFKYQSNLKKKKMLWGGTLKAP